MFLDIDSNGSISFGIGKLSGLFIGMPINQFNHGASILWWDNEIIFQRLLPNHCPSVWHSGAHKTINLLLDAFLKSTEN